MNFLKNLNIKKQILLSFSLIVLLIVTTNYFVFSLMNDLNENVNLIAQNWLPSIEKVGEIRYQLSQYRTRMYQKYTYTDSSRKLLAQNRLTTTKDTINLLFKDYEHLILNEKEKKIYLKISEDLNELFNLENKYFSKNNHYDKKSIEDFLENDFRNLFNKTSATYEELIVFNKNGGNIEAENAKKTYNNGIKILIFISIFIALFAITISIVTSNLIVKNVKNIINNIKLLVNNISEGNLDNKLDINGFSIDFKEVPNELNNLLEVYNQPLKITTNYIQSISNGNIPKEINVIFKGEFKILIESINQLINNLNSFVEEMQNMSSEHEKGDIDVLINTSKFRGTYFDMAKGVNEMVLSHINVKKAAMKIIADYSKGDFNSVMMRLPGKKAFIHETLDLVQKNLKNVNLTISNLSLNAKNGNLSERADISQFEGDWSKMVNEINILIDQLLAPINEAVSVLQEMSDGNFNTSMTGNYNGDHAILKHAINQTIEQMPFKEAVSILQKLADGDFRSQMTGDYKGDSLMLKNSLNSTIESITDILNQVAQTVDEVTRGSMQVADASTSLSQGATEQAASLEEITSSMSEIGSQTNTNAHNASTASNLTFQSKNSAERGNQEMGDLNKAMSEITQSSRDISKIIKVIDEIAFQTNLLALNAAVEAARAGRHGKGFAVVAEEVRNLAARSASAAKETAEMIEDSIRIVEKGSNLAIKTSEALEEIRTGAIKAADIVGEIAQSSNEQANAISQISEALHQIDKVTQTNTASAEESASASEELSGQASNLKRMIMKFKLPQQNQYYQKNNDSFALTSNNYNQKSTKKVLAPKSNYNQNPEDFINLDNDDFGRY